MNISLKKIKTAWQVSVASERQRVSAQPDLTIAHKGEIVGRNLQVIEGLITRFRTLGIQLPNRLEVNVVPNDDKSDRFSVVTIGNFREIISRSMIACSLPPHIEFDLAPQGKAFEKQIATPLSKAFGCQQVDHIEFLPNIALTPLTENQAAETIRKIHDFDAFDEKFKPPSLRRTVIGTISHLRAG